MRKQLMRALTVIGVAAGVFVTWSNVGWGMESSPPPRAPFAAAADVIPVLSAQEAGELGERLGRSYSMLSRSVVRIYTRHAGPEGKESIQPGFSGVIISDDGLVLTCAHHGLAPNTAVTIELGDGRRSDGVMLGRFIPARGQDAYPDIGLARIETKGDWPAVELGGEPVAAGTTCLGIGYPGTLAAGKPPLLRVGRALPGRARESYLYATTTYMPGDSGGALFDLAGRVVGVVHGGTPQLPTAYQPVTPLAAVRGRMTAGDLVEYQGGDGAYRSPLRSPTTPRSAFVPDEGFDERVSEARRSVVQVLSGTRPIALGMIVSRDGLVITKRTLVAGRDELACRTAYQSSGPLDLPAKVLGESVPHDLVLLKVEGADMPVTPWAARRPALGSAVASPVPLALPTHFSIVGASVASEDPPEGDVAQLPLMVTFGGGGKGEPLAQCMPGHGGELADTRRQLRPGDVLVRLDGSAIATLDDLGRVMGGLLYAPGVEVRPENLSRLKSAVGSFAGEEVDVVVRRGDAEIAIRIPRVHSATGLSELLWHTEPLSLRRDGFPAVFAHDGPLSPELCGGPVVDREGRVLGLNIARADWTRTLAVPADAIQSVIAELRH